MTLSVLASIVVLRGPKSKAHRTFGEKSGLMIVCALANVEWTTIWHDASGSTHPDTGGERIEQPSPASPIARDVDDAGRRPGEPVH